MSDAGTINHTPEELVNKYLMFVRKIANNLAARLVPWIDRDDLYSAGLFGLLQAARKWNPEEGVDFMAYAGLRVKGAMLDEIRDMDFATRKARRTDDGESVPVVHPFSYFEGKIGRKLDFVSGDSSPTKSLEYADLLLWAENRLPKRLAYVLHLHCECGYTMKMIAEKLSLTEVRVSQMMKDIHRRLNRAALAEPSKVVGRPAFAPTWSQSFRGLDRT